jgi:PST family polysaccharide transporter
MLWFYSAWKPKLLFSMMEIKKVFSYIANLTGFSFVNYFSSNADNFLIGKFLGSSSLGVYSLAYKIMLFPLQQISQTLLRVLFPAFSQIKDDNEKFKRAYLKVIFFIALVSFPLMMGLVAVSDVFVSVVFGEKWKNLAILLSILAPIGMLRSISTTLGSIYLAKGTTDRMFWIGSVGAFVMVVSIIAGLPFGVEGVAYALVIANIIMLYPNFRYAWIQIDLDLKEGFSEIFPVLVISVFMCMGVLSLDYFVTKYIDNQLVRLTVMIGSGILIYVVLLRLRYKNIMLLVKELKK